MGIRSRIHKTMNPNKKIGLRCPQTMGEEPSQREKISERSDKGKGVAEKTPSSSKGRPLVEHIPR